MLRVRDWRVRTKLVAVLAVPALAFASVAGMQTSASVRQAATLSALADQVALGAQVSVLIHELQFERDQVSGWLAAVAAAPASDRDRDELMAALAEAHLAVTEAWTAFDQAAVSLRERPALRDPLAEATLALDELATVHTGIEQGWLTQRAVFDGYTRAIEALLALLAAPAAAAGVEAGAYQDLAALKELSAQIRGQVFALTSAGTTGPGGSEQVVDIQAQRRAAQDQFRANATAGQLAWFDEVVRGQAVRGKSRLEQAVMEQAATGVVEVDPDQWWSASTTELELIREVEAGLLAEARDRAGQGSRDQWRQTGLVTAATLFVLLLCLLTSIGIGRSMVRSLRRLHEQAMDVAHQQLPGLLARLRRTGGAVPAVDEVQRLTAGGADEVGEVADAFTQVHRSAVELAVEQAVMRRNVNAIFVNLARRSQVLVERQLELLDDLERDEVEPDQLQGLFRLDHLATRMRRNNESLLVLTDAGTTRLYHRPMPLAVVAVAAIAEIEQYQRVREEVAGDLHMVGRAVGDLVHLLAELLDNATSFSARDTTVRLTARRLSSPDGASIDIVDSGLGMSQATLNEANALLASPPVIDVAASERMGLVVVSHLAARHGVHVHLTATSSGVRARVWLPAGLLAAPLADGRPGDGPTVLRVPALVRPGGDPAVGGAIRAEDVLAVAEPAARARTATVAGGPAGAATTLLAPAPAPTVSGTSAHGLPIRVPQAHLPGSASGRARPNGAAPWRAADPDPEDVGRTLSSLYSGIRRAEADPPEPDQPAPDEQQPSVTEAERPGGASGGPEQGST